MRCVNVWPQRARATVPLTVRIPKVLPRYSAIVAMQDVLQGSSEAKLPFFLGRAARRPISFVRKIFILWARGCAAVKFRLHAMLPPTRLLFDLLRVCRLRSESFKFATAICRPGGFEARERRGHP